MGLINSEKYNELTDLSGGNEDLIKVLLDKYLTNSKEFIKKLKEDIKNNDTEKIQFAIHTLKGSSLSLGLTKLGEIFTDLNVRVKNGNFDGLEFEILNIEKLLVEVEDYYKSLK
jgi:HPt (histidine-containing phosphotransfer) domain-containing protein